MMDKVLCPYCGEPMKLDRTFMSMLPAGERPHFWYLCGECGSRSPAMETASAALSAAMQRYVEPNGVLTLEEAYDRNAKVHEALTRDYLAVKSERDRFKARAEAAERDITALARRAIDGFQDSKFITPCRWCAEREQCDLLTNGMNTCFKWRGPQEGANQ